MWLLACGREHFLSYDRYPWFKDAKVAEVYDVRLLHGAHLHWPALDVDLELDALDHPEKYPLKYRQLDEFAARSDGPRLSFG